jgi:Uncharacterised protein family (UPF0104).
VKVRAGTIVHLGSLTLGAVLFAMLVRRLDMREVALRLHQVGLWFGLHCAFYLLGIMVTTAAWQQLIDPAHSRARFRDLFAAFWVGHAINMVTPGASLGEVVKNTIMQEKVDSAEMVASLVIFNFMSTVSMLTFNLIGPLMCLWLLDLPARVVLLIFGVGLVFFVPMTLLWLMLRAGAASHAVRLLAKLPFVRFKDPAAIVAKAASVDVRIHEARIRRPRRFWWAVACLAAARLMNVAEYWALLLALVPGRGPAWLFVLAMLTQTSSYLLAWVLTFVPAQVGVAEGNTTMLYNLLGLGSSLGFAMEILRRIKGLMGIAVGLTLGWIIGLRPSGHHRMGTRGQASG